MVEALQSVCNPKVLSETAKQTQKRRENTHTHTTDTLLLLDEIRHLLHDKQNDFHPSSWGIGVRVTSPVLCEVEEEEDEREQVPSYHAPHLLKKLRP